MSADGILRASRRARRKKLYLKAILILLFFCVFLGGIVALFCLPRFKVAAISFVGLDSLKEEDLKREISRVLGGKFYGILPYENILMVPCRKVSSVLLEKFPLLRSVSVIREFPRTLLVKAEEREAEALWCPGISSTSTAFGEGECAYVDSEGFIFRPAPVFSGTIFLRFFDERNEPSAVGREILDRMEFGKLAVLIVKMTGKDLDVTKVILKEDGVYEMYFGEGWYVLLNDKNEPEEAFSNLELVLSTTIKEKRPQLDYIDLRFGKKVFFKLKDSI